MTKYQDVKDLSTEEYFNNNKFSIDAFRKKYAINDEETYVQAIKRVCDYIALAEKPELREYWSERWFDEIFNDWWHPAGSIMQGANCGKKISLLNCTTISLGSISQNEEWDTLESIIKNTAFTVAKCAAYRQGLGVDFSRLRPAEANVLNSSNKSQGAIHWMKFIDSIGYYVGQRGRIPAMLFSISCTHPDVEDFIKVKSDYTKIQNANISVQVTDAFYKAVEKDLDWEMSFEIQEVKIGDKIYVDEDSKTRDAILDKSTNKWYIVSKHNRPYEKITKTCKARYLLELIAKNMMNNSEPGIQNIDLAKKYSNSDYLYDENSIYDTRIISTNACSEQYLSRDSLCCLASINAGRFPASNYEEQLKKISYSINRFLDNVNEMEIQGHTYATPMQRIATEQLRRTGAGYTNLCAWLLKRGEIYGSKKSIKSTEEFTKLYNYYMYESSINLGKEKGNFKAFHREKFEKSPFIQRMMDLGLKFETMRNVTCSSLAPTGTLSLMFRDCVLSYGAEPGFGLYFWKRTRISGKYEYYFCVPSVVREIFSKKGFNIPISSDTIKDDWAGTNGKVIVDFIEKNKEKVDIHFVPASEVSVFDKLDMMAGMMKWVDSSISITYMLPEKSKWQDIYDFILLARKKEVKSIAAFPDRKMYGIVSFEPFKSLAKRLIVDDNISIHSQNFSEDELKEVGTWGNIFTQEIPSQDAIKRPKELDCHIYHYNSMGVVIGLLNGTPYEVFFLNDFKPTKQQKLGKIIKIKQKHYRIVCEDEILLENAEECCSQEQEAMARLTSLSLRHNVNLDFIIKQLETVKGDMWDSCRALCKALRHYTKDKEEIRGDSCPECKNKVIREEGCKKCTSCTWSACG